MADYNALQVPPQARERGGIEVLRAAVIDGGLHVTLRRAFDDPRAWGVLLADVARQVARVYTQESNGTDEKSIAAIRAAFDTEMNAPANPGSISPVT